MFFKVSKYKPHLIGAVFLYLYKLKQLTFILKLIIRAGLWFFCKKIYTKNKHLLRKKGPLLIIANHPNSFLDAIIIGAQYKRKVNFIARGDVFKKPFYRFLLRLLNMIPIYRLREGKENLHLNESAFNESIKLLSKGEALLIFIEGVCINSHELQPLKKGTVRIIERLQKNGIQPVVHILGIAYNQMNGIGKIITISINKFTLNLQLITPKDRLYFNQKVAKILNENIIPSQQPTNFKKTPIYYLHYPYYNFISRIVYKKTKGTVFFDSVLFSLLLFTYPLFIFILFGFLYFLHIPLPIIFIILLSIIILGKNSIH